MAILVRPLITEKTLTLANNRQYTFEVDRRATKQSVADAIRAHYQFTPLHVAIINVMGKERRTRRGMGMTNRMKKAIVTLKKDQQIPGFAIDIKDTKDAHNHDKDAHPKTDVKTTTKEKVK